MNPPLVTVVVPAYRRLDYLGEALASALAQSWRDFEIIVTDDSSSSEIARLAASFADSRIRYRGNAHHLGIAMNHYVAFSEARGRYLTCLHDDDSWEPDFLAELVPPLEADASVSVAFCNHHLMDEQGQVLRARTEDNSRTYRRNTLAPGRHQPFFELAIVNESIPMAMGAVFRKSILEGADYPPRIGGCYDYWLVYLAARNNAAAYYVPKFLSRYRIHTNSGSVVRGSRNLQNAIYVRTQFLNNPLLAPWRKEIANSLGVFYGKLALFFLDRKEFHRAWIIGKRAFALVNRPKNFIGLVKNAIIHFFKGIGK